MVACIIYYCADNYYDRVCPIDGLGRTLANPGIVLVESVSLPKPINAAMFLLNSWLWGIVLSNVGRWFLKYFRAEKEQGGT